MSKYYLHFALRALQEASNNIIKEYQAEKVGDIIQSRAIVSAAAGIGAAILPTGGGSLIAAAVAVGAVWEMYFQINRELGISISDNKLKSLASAILSNLLANAGSALLILATAFLGGMIPVVNTLMAPIQAMIAYIAVFAAGILYLKLLTNLFKAQGSFDMSNFDEKEEVKKVIEESDIDSMIDELKDSYNDDKEKIKEQKRKQK